jgi:hypothetical protein
VDFTNGPPFGFSPRCIDIRLGTWFMNLRQARMAHLPIDAPGAQPQLTKTHYVPFGSEYYLHPATSFSA